jgi:hypothetical protein
MEPKKGINFALTIIALIVGSAALRNVEFSTLSVRQPALTALYTVVFIGSVYAILHERKKKS